MRRTVTKVDLAQSVMAVPPLALDKDGAFADEANAKIIAHLEAGGVDTLLYGGNALLYHWPMSRYGDWLDRLEAMSGADSWLIPSVGADAGRLVDQAPILRARGYPAALFLPAAGPTTPDGVVAALRRFYDESGTQLIAYVKTDNAFTPDMLAALDKAGALLGVKYAVPRETPETDPLLTAFIDTIGADRIVSGFGEPPAVNHLLNFGVAAFTSGSVCIAPALSMAILAALKAGDKAETERLMAPIMPLERLRGEINEIRVLHTAVALAGIAETGDPLAFSSPVPEAEHDRIRTAARTLLDAEMARRSAVAA
ncbi:dihydrodipicolinate synthase family protein [Acuticoccus sp. M5D2P5]|uniref:dihydrodipicolinate synthase family protein n=1 Tax=Acuticoccus kalidii TaxID=2910977 RepID=UPI001F3D0748|nr:dihydrodipicolinate synthase family protein [Acuticoccus kalidii]MCF3935182.1 dihydrodipicolinate synthase family protein [Acuticoccus kalidii]